MSRSRPASPFRRVARILGYGSFLVLAGVVGTLVGWVKSSDVLTAAAIGEIRREPPKEAFGGQDSVNILLLGCDEDRAPGGKKILRENARSDMMLVARLDFAKNQITGISIPRDVLVDMSGYRPMKINAFHSLGGKELAQRAVEYVLGVHVDRTVVINYKAMQEMVDLIGGIPIYVPKRMKWNDDAGDLHIDLKPGRQVLDGYDAMCFVRYRHGDSDFKRQERQKEFLVAFKEQALRSPSLLGKLADQAVEVMGGELDAREVAALARFARMVGQDQIRMGQVPVLTASRTNLKIDEAHLRETLKQYSFVEDRTSLKFPR